MRTTDSQPLTATKLKRIAWLSGRDKKKVFSNLMHLFNKESLLGCFNELSGRKAVGIDGINKEQYREHLEQNIEELLFRMRAMSYKPGPVRQVLIPKEGKPGATRPLGITNFEDKIVQKMFQKVLESIYDPIFHDSSYGFRTGRSCHTAVKDLLRHLYISNTEIVIDIDLENFFGSINHKILENFIRQKIHDEKFVRYLIRMFKSGILAENELRISEDGVLQGSPCSPVLSNIFAHYVLDEWIENMIKSRCIGNIKLFRYCDDAVICCQSEYDANRIMKVLGKRLSKFGVKLNEEKTSLVKFSKRNFEKGTKHDTFDFLGFTFYLGVSRKGRVIPKLKTSSKRLSSKLRNVNRWSRMVKNRYKLLKIWKFFCMKMVGHIRYFGVSFNMKSVEKFLQIAIKILFKWLNRRSQRKSFNWEKFNLFLENFPPPKVKIYHSMF